MTNTMSVLGKAVTSAFGVFVQLGHFLVFDLAKSFMWFSFNIIGGVTTALTSMLLAVVGLIASLALLPVVIAVIGAPIATLVIGLIQLSSIIGDRLTQAWEAMREGARDGLEWVGRKVTEVTDGATAMWTVLIRGGRVFFAQTAAGISTVAGLLWNFRENFAVIIDYFQKYGDILFDDLILASMEAVDAIGHNFGKLARALGTSLVAVMQAAWGNVTDISMTFLIWFKNEWLNIGRDLATVFRAIFGSLLNNFLVLVEAGFSILSARALDLARWPTMSEKAREALIEKRQGQEGLIMEDAINNLAGPFQGMKVEDFKTNFGVLGETMAGTLGRAGNHWKIAGRNAAKAFGEAFAGMNPILQAFMDLQDLPIWKALFSELNAELPGFKEAGDFLKRTLGLGEMGGEGLGKAIGGGGGPGFTFKQGSMERFMYDGATNEKIQYQMLHLTQGIRKDVAIIAAQHGNSATPRPTTWRPPLVAPWHPPLVLE
jgi:hypothetical protein